MPLKSPRRIVLFGLAAVAILTVALVNVEHNVTTATDISPDDAYAMAAADNVLLIDIRRPEEWRETGVPNVGIALDMRQPDFIMQLLELSDGNFDTPIALICARGVRSARLTAQLRSAGFTQIHNVSEGMLGSAAGPGWLRRGLPVKAGS